MGCGQNEVIEQIDTISQFRHCRRERFRHGFRHQNGDCLSVRVLTVPKITQDFNSPSIEVVNPELLKL